MLREHNSIQELITSRNGIHLTGYIHNDRRDVNGLIAQILQVIEKAEKFLQPVMSRAEREQFLRPVSELASDQPYLSQMKSSFGLFRTSRSFHLVPVPVDVKPKCIVATTFHIKPLLKWLQSEQDFLLLGIGLNDAHLYLGNQCSFEKLGSVELSEEFQVNSASRQVTQAKISSRVIRENIRNLSDWINRLAPATQGRLYVAGTRLMSEAFLRSRAFKNVYKTPIWSSFSEGHISMIVDLIRKMSRREGSLRFERSLFEFSHIHEKKNLSRDLDEIARAAAQGRVRKLIISDEIEIFGKFDTKNGGLRIHNQDLDHEDDDILDDLAQNVIAGGGEVLVAHIKPISESSPILALLDYKENGTQFC